MKIVKIYNYRCGEIEDDATYVIDSKDRPNEEISEDINLASKHYINTLVSLKKAKHHTKELRSTSNCIYPNEFQGWETIQDILEEIKNIEQEELKQREELELAKKSFESFLNEKGYELLNCYKDIVEMDLDWGHNHGIDIEYGEVIQKIVWINTL